MYIVKLFESTVATFKHKEDAEKYIQDKNSLCYFLLETKNDKKRGRKPKLSYEKQKEILQKLEQGATQYQLAKEYNVSWATIHNIKTSYENPFKRIMKQIENESLSLSSTSIHTQEKLLQDKLNELDQKFFSKN